jgi:hypothetical protein
MLTGEVPQISGLACRLEVLVDEYVSASEKNSALLDTIGELLLETGPADREHLDDALDLLEDTAFSSRINQMRRMLARGRGTVIKLNQL